jgi:hypothetical protein
VNEMATKLTAVPDVAEQGQHEVLIMLEKGKGGLDEFATLVNLVDRAAALDALAMCGGSGVTHRRGD